MLKMKTCKVFIKEVGWWVKNRAGNPGLPPASIAHRALRRKNDGEGVIEQVRYALSFAVP
jgi:hypothetical protein